MDKYIDKYDNYDELYTKKIYPEDLLVVIPVLMSLFWFSY